MQSYRSLLAVCAAGLATMALAGCTTNEMTADDSSPTVQKMSNLSGESDVHPQYITPEMQRFDPGIGDTGRGLGGGGADEQK